MSDVVHVAMWSGPRNISTAMMRSWGNRPDTAVCDEPLYAHYLLKTGVQHPGAEEVIRSQENDWRKVVARLTEYEPPGKSIFYQKHMTHHLLAEIDHSWLDRMSNVFLIREPREVIASFGGAANQELAQACSTVDATAAQYEAVIDRYGLTSVDFDIEEVLTEKNVLMAVAIHITDADAKSRRELGFNRKRPGLEVISPV